MLILPPRQAFPVPEVNGRLVILPIGSVLTLVCRVMAGLGRVFPRMVIMLAWVMLAPILRFTVCSRPVISLVACPLAPLSLGRVRTLWWALSSLGLSVSVRLVTQSWSALWALVSVRAVSVLIRSSR